MQKNIMNFDNVYINYWASTVGKKEYEGPLRDTFDAYDSDEYFGCDSFEKAESEMVRRNINLLCGKANIEFNNIDLITGGDLVNQCVSTSFAISNTNIPFLGLYGACSTMIEALICGSTFIKSNNVNNAICFASSHFCTAERQYRFPLEYGSLKTPTSQHTVTGTGAFLISNNANKIKIKNAVIGRIIDNEITDQNNMGAAMAGAAVDTIMRFVRYCDNDIDLIVTGDLGIEGHEIASSLLKLESVDFSNKFLDCGMLIYDTKKQKMLSGGSGCGCIASVSAGHIMHLLETNKIKNVLLVGTGALLNTNSVLEKRHIPAIAHAVYITSEE